MLGVVVGMEISPLLLFHVFQHHSGKVNTVVASTATHDGVVNYRVDGLLNLLWYCPRNDWITVI